MDDPDAAREQITWEYHHLRLPRAMVLFWFPASDPAVTVQPIALFELGSALCRRSLDRPLVIGADPAYPRRFDLVEQLSHDSPDLAIHDNLEAVLAEARVLLDPDHALRTGS